MATKKPQSDLAKKGEGAIPDGALKQYVTPLVAMEAQVGGHVIHALQQENTVAVLTTVVPGPTGAQCIVSVGLDAERMDQVQELLSASQTKAQEGIPCVGFHCLLPKRQEEA
ncbi:MAG: hypothetical protein L0219_05310 [Phycisphaerales bacterium]|nr:hypothetical protein [Phycisphaerales bacterium]MCI0675020.1 hypothetical protein [Phycisphaerales bacterium]